MPVPKEIAVLTPWKTITNEAQAIALTRELEKEVSSKHVLNGRTIRAVAARMDKDEVLFEIEHEGMSLAVVHMTWSRETNHQWPRANLFRDWNDWVLHKMTPDHDEYFLTADTK